MPASGRVQQAVDLLEHPDLLAVDDAVGSSHGNREFRENLAPADVDAFEPPLDPAVLGFSAISHCK